MGRSANVTSTDAIRQFAAAVLAFQEEARMCLTVLDSQLRHILFWLEQDRPQFWKREIENCSRDMTEARVRLHQCRMRRLGDFRPSCIEEVKALEQAKRDMEFAQMQVPRVKRWHAEATHEGNEYRGRAAQLVQAIERDVPRLLALLAFTLDRLEAYATVSATPDVSADASFLESLTADVEKMLKELEGKSAGEQDEKSETAPVDSTSTGDCDSDDLGSRA
ncbi:MAG: hypothetical protein JNM43_24170 [Planctomycetaceae bacterium]|nr:hypothetical protein [Planctomycetaceae bacterium]